MEVLLFYKIFMEICICVYLTGIHKCDTYTCVNLFSETNSRQNKNRRKYKTFEKEAYNLVFYIKIAQNFCS